MKPVTRRKFGQLTLGAAAAATLAPVSAGAAAARVVIIGGGAGGATAARYLKRDTPGLDVTLIEPKRIFTTCFYSNLYLGGLTDFDTISHDYTRLRDLYGVRMVHEPATEIDPVARKVKTAGGREFAYDRLILSPGIDFDTDAIEGYGPEAQQVMPHAYRGGTDLKRLRAQVEALEDGANFVLVPPPAPYRCPPAPYERISMLAWLMQNRGKTINFTIVDVKNSFSKQDLFLEGWAKHYPDQFEWLPLDITGGVRAVRPQSMEIVTEDEVFKADAANIIPPQKAGLIAHRAGLTDASGWCPVRPADMRSALAEDIHVIGDAAQAAEMPKSAVAANSQAKAVAMIIRAELTGAPRFTPKYRNACWSMIAAGDAIALGASYKPGEDRIVTTGVYSSRTQEAPKIRRAGAREVEGWYSGISRDIFG